MSAPCVSYCVPAFNVGDTLEACVSSILAEGTQDIEIIVVDDASTDVTNDVAAALCRQDQRIRLISHDYNMGLPSARNTALASAQGQYIRHVDSDDLITRGSTAHLLQIIGDADVARGSSLAFLTSDGPRQPMDWANRGIGRFRINGLFDSGFFRGNAIGYVWLYLYRRSFLESLGMPRFREGLSILEDDIYNAAVLPMANGIAVTDEVVALYRAGGMSSGGHWSFRQYMEQASALSIVSSTLAAEEKFLACYLNRKALFVLAKTGVVRRAGLSFDQFCAYAELIRSLFLHQNLALYREGAPGRPAEYMSYNDRELSILQRIVAGELDLLYGELEH